MALSDAEIKQLSDQGYSEGDFVPGRGLLLPSGEFDINASPQGAQKTVVPGGGTGVGDTTGSAGSATDTFLSTLREKLMAGAGAISSEDTNIEKKIQEAIGGITAGNKASTALVESSFGRQIEEAKELGTRELTAFTESSRGFAVNNAAVQRITENAEKRIKDLEQRKQELILQGNAASAGQVSNLIMKELEFEQQARIQSFSNLLNIGNFTLKMLETQATLKGAGTIKASDIDTFTDTSGNVTAKHKITGATLWTAKVGRAGSASPNITVKTVPDPVTGNVAYTLITDQDTGTVTAKDVNGNTVDPSKVQIGKPADPLDTIIGDVLSSIADELIK